eukprot:TRINITY_DN35612_c0_g1_i1.p1 TRINITY_DN35612_c0_g1~~TRINITY_DN35612_c0_g1_i1.p1  ORF type:complete len:1466 (-),score=242.11 TRINITY_DN35612_c0_g1_i1:76-3921(-)
MARIEVEEKHWIGTMPRSEKPEASADATPPVNGAPDRAANAGCRCICTKCKPLPPCVWAFALHPEEADAALAAACRRGAAMMDFRRYYDVANKKLGHGSFATAYLAVPRKASKIPFIKYTQATAPNVVLKVLDKPACLKNPEKMMRTIHQELAMMIACQAHPNVIKLHCSAWEVTKVEEDGEKRSVTVPALCVDFYACGDLFEYVRAYEIEEFLARKLIRGVLTGLAHVHSREVVHRDVKPENIFLEQDLRPVLADFGIAALLSDKEQLSKRVGSPGYVSPEVLLGKTYDVRVDTFSAGVVLYFIFTQTSPFIAKDVKESLRKVVSEKINFEAAGMENVTHDCKQFIKVLTRRLDKQRPTCQRALTLHWLRQPDLEEEPMKASDNEELESEFLSKSSLQLAYSEPSATEIPDSEQFRKTTSSSFNNYTLGAGSRSATRTQSKGTKAGERPASAVSSKTNNSHDNSNNHDKLGLDTSADTLLATIKSKKEEAEAGDPIPIEDTGRRGTVGSDRKKKSLCSTWRSALHFFTERSSQGSGCRFKAYDKSESSDEEKDRARESFMKLAPKPVAAAGETVGPVEPAVGSDDEGRRHQDFGRKASGTPGWASVTLTSNQLVLGTMGTQLTFGTEDVDSIPGWGFGNQGACKGPGNLNPNRFEYSGPKPNRLRLLQNRFSSAPSRSSALRLMKPALAEEGSADSPERLSAGGPFKRPSSKSDTMALPQRSSAPTNPKRSKGKSEKREVGGSDSETDSSGSDGERQLMENIGRGGAAATATFVNTGVKAAFEPTPPREPRRVPSGSACKQKFAGDGGGAEAAPSSRPSSKSSRLPFNRFRSTPSRFAGGGSGIRILDGIDESMEDFHPTAAFGGSYVAPSRAETDTPGPETGDTGASYSFAASKPEPSVKADAAAQGEPEPEIKLPAGSAGSRPNSLRLTRSRFSSTPTWPAAKSAPTPQELAGLASADAPAIVEEDDAQVDRPPVTGMRSCQAPAGPFAGRHQSRLGVGKFTSAPVRPRVKFVEPEETEADGAEGDIAIVASPPEGPFAMLRKAAPSIPADLCETPPPAGGGYRAITADQIDRLGDTGGSPLGSGPTTAGGGRLRLGASQFNSAPLKSRPRHLEKLQLEGRRASFECLKEEPLEEEAEDETLLAKDSSPAKGATGGASKEQVVPQAPDAAASRCPLPVRRFSSTPVSAASASGTTRPRKLPTMNQGGQRLPDAAPIINKNPINFFSSSSGSGSDESESEASDADGPKKPTAATGLHVPVSGLKKIVGASLDGPARLAG